MTEKDTEGSITIDGQVYKPEDLSEAAQVQLANIRFVDGRLLQLNSELAVSDTARIAYLSALKSGLPEKSAK